MEQVHSSPSPRNGQLLPMKDAYKLAIDAFDILVKEKTLGRINVPVGPGDWLGGRVAGAGAGPT